MSKRLFALLVALMAMFTIAACTPASDDDDEPGDDDVVLEDIVDTAIEAGDFTTLVAALVETELDEALRGEGPFTVFAPSDEAFAALLDALDVTAEDLLAREDLADILLYHVVEGEFLAEDVVAAAPFEPETLLGETLSITLDNGEVMVNDAKVVTTDIETSNGVIHVIDAVLLPPADEDDDDEEPELGTIVDVAVASEEFNTLVAALTEAGLVDALSGEGPFTVFAPTDAAFEAVLNELDITAEDLLSLAGLADILLYHVLEGEFLAEDVVAAAPFEAETLLGEDLFIALEDGAVIINGVAVVTITDVEASNGVIHVIDVVLLPPTDAVVFLTLDELAYFDGLEGRPAYVAVDGFIYDVSDSDLWGDGNHQGQVQAGQDLTEVIDEESPHGRSTLDRVPKIGLLVEAEEEEEPELGTIVETAIAADDFETLVAAVLEAELDGALSGEGPFTVFAPTDAAFADLLEALDATPEELLAREDLADILLYHVVSGEFLAEAVIDGAPLTVETLNGEDLEITVEDGVVTINGVATVVTPDVLASNGVIHVIDAVLLPPTEEEEEEPELGTIVDVAIEAGNFTTLVAALTTTELDSVLSGEGPFTVFAPTDAAFGELLDALGVTAEELLAREDLAAILTYHVLAGEFLAEDVVAAAPFEPETVLGETLSITLENGTVLVNDATVVTTDIETSNGVIHVIDTVLLPPAEEEEEPELGTIVETAVAADDFETLVAAVLEAELDGALSEEGPFTVFAPTDAAFADLLEALDATPEELLAREDLADILLYHVVSGEFLAEAVIDGAPLTVETLNGEDLEITVEDGVVTINGVATVVTPDVLASNGVIHVIDTVLLPPAEEEEEEPELGTIVETAIAADDFETLVAAVLEAELDGALSEEGPFTVFAPTDAAFADLLEALDATPEELLAREDLADILLYHVVANTQWLEEVLEGYIGTLTIQTMNGEFIEVDAEDGTIFVNDVAAIITADVLASNGVIHVIDTVLLPPEDEDNGNGEDYDNGEEMPNGETGY